jgi:hypothetical protein
MPIQEIGSAIFPISMNHAIPDSPTSEPTRHVAITIDLKFALPWHQDCYQGIMQYGQQHGWRCSLDLYASGVHGDLSASPYDGVVGRISDDVAERLERHPCEAVIAS